MVTPAKKMFFFLMHRPKRYSISRKRQYLRNIAKRKKRHDKTAGCYNLQDGSKW